MNGRNYYNFQQISDKNFINIVENNNMYQHCKSPQWFDVDFLHQNEHDREYRTTDKNLNQDIYQYIP